MRPGGRSVGIGLFLLVMLLSGCGSSASTSSGSTSGGSVGGGSGSTAGSTSGAVVYGSGSVVASSGQYSFTSLRNVEFDGKFRDGGLNPDVFVIEMDFGSGGKSCRDEASMAETVLMFVNRAAVSLGRIPIMTGIAPDGGAYVALYFERGAPGSGTASSIAESGSVTFDSKLSGSFTAEVPGIGADGGYLSLSGTFSAVQCGSKSL
jgi:hypothetical protein